VHVSTGKRSPGRFDVSNGDSDGVRFVAAFGGASWKTGLLAAAPPL
jgi:hypothetical protein